MHVQHFGQGANEHCLAQAWYAFQQHVATGQHADQDAVDDLTLADDDPPDLSFDRLGDVGEVLWGELQLGGVNQCLRSSGINGGD